MSVLHQRAIIECFVLLYFLPVSACSGSATLFTVSPVSSNFLPSSASPNSVYNTAVSCGTIDFYYFLCGLITLSEHTLCSGALLAHELQGGGEREREYKSHKSLVLSIILELLST